MELVPNTVFTNWHYLVQPYVKSVGLFKCPSNTSEEKAYNNASTAEKISNNYVANLSTVTTVPDAQLVMTYNDGKNLSSFGSPATTIIVAENLAESGETNGLMGIDNPPTTNNSGGNRLFAGHLSTSNYLFADGHVKSLKPYATIDASAGGSSSVNLWTLDNTPFVTTVADAKANLATVTAKYQ